jgi:hypothetical protein
MKGMEENTKTLFLLLSLLSFSSLLNKLSAFRAKDFSCLLFGKSSVVMFRISVIPSTSFLWAFQPGPSRGSASRTSPQNAATEEQEAELKAHKRAESSASCSSTRMVPGRTLRCFLRERLSGLRVSVVTFFDPLSRNIPEYSGTPQ